MCNNPLGVTATSFVTGFVMLFLHFSPRNKHNGSVVGCVGKRTQMDDNPNQPCHGAHVQCLGYRGSSLDPAVQPRQHRCRYCLLTGLGHASKRVSRTPLCLVLLPWDTWGSHTSVVNRGAPQLVLCQPSHQVSKNAHACSHPLHPLSISYSHHSPSPWHKQGSSHLGEFNLCLEMCVDSVLIVMVPSIYLNENSSTEQRNTSVEVEKMTSLALHYIYCTLTAGCGKLWLSYL